MDVSWLDKICYSIAGIGLVRAVYGRDWGVQLSVLGVVLILLLGGKMLWDEKHPAPVDYVAEGKALDGDRRDDLFQEMRAEHEERLTAKRQKLERLNQHMSAWYGSMSQRREALASATPEQLAKFNDEANAYKELHEVTKKEAAELQTLLNKRYDGWGLISDEEYGRYIVARRSGARNGGRKTVQEMVNSQSQDDSEQ